MVATHEAVHSPIFVLGTPRSGTTLTAQILGKHSRIFMPGETHFFDDIFSRQNELGDIEDPVVRAKVADRLATLYERYYEPPDQQRINHLFASAGMREALIAPSKSYCEVMSRFMEIQMRHEQKMRWGNNVPRDMFNVNDIVRCYPSAKILVCVRDVRDFLVSYKTKWKITSENHINRLKALYHPVVTSLLWKSSMRQIRMIKTKVSAHNLMIIRYEDLVNDPETVVRKMCEFVGEQFEPNMLNVDTHNSSVQTGGGGIFSSSIGTWRFNLTAEETYIAQLLNGKELHAFGYETKHQKINLIRIIWTFISSPFAAVRALYVNRAMRGGSVLAYMYRRLSSFFV
jgi:hypothetical protein